MVVVVIAAAVAVGIWLLFEDEACCAWFDGDWL